MQSPRGAQGAALFAAVDIGTVSTRLALCLQEEDGTARMLERDARITDLGEGVDRTGRLTEAAVARVLGAVGDYLALVRARSAELGAPAVAICTATSAARDAANAADLLGPLRAMGLEAQVIDGEVEASLALLGVTADFGGDPVLVADVGGGSTELACGRRGGAGALERGPVRSHDVGCRRLAERFFGPQAAPGGERAAREEVARSFAAYLDELGERRPERLVCVGGTATTLVAVTRKLVPYDPAAVHLAALTRAEVHELARRLLDTPLDELRHTPGLQPKRAAVIGPGALILDVLMEQGGWDSYQASESDSLQGLLACARARAFGEACPCPGWQPKTTFLGEPGCAGARGGALC